MNWLDSEPRLCVCICLIVIAFNLKKSAMKFFPRLDSPTSTVKGYNRLSQIWELPELKILVPH